VAAGQAHWAGPAKGKLSAHPWSAPTTNAPADRNILAGRQEQAFPRLIPAEIDRLRRFGEVRTFGESDVEEAQA
jgi:hypothetical protein